MGGEIFRNLTRYRNNVEISIFCKRVWNLIKSRRKRIRRGKRKKMSAPQNVEMRVGHFSLLFSVVPLLPASLDNLSGISGRILRAIVRRRAHDLYFFTIFFSLPKPFFTARACAGFIEFIPKITPYNLVGKIGERKI